MTIFDTQISMMLVAGLSVLMVLIFGVILRGVFYYARQTDNQLIIKAAATADQWKTLSGMHAFAGGKAHMKEFAVAALALMQRILRDKTSDYSLIMLCFVSNGLSALFIYLIALQYWGVKVALLLFALFLFSFWPVLIALWGGVVAVAQVVALASIYFLQLAEKGPIEQQLCWYMAAGVMSALVIFASASSRKYLPLMAAAFFWSLRGALAPVEDGSLVTWSVGLLATLCIVLGVALKFNIKGVVTAIYEERSLGPLNRLIKNRSRSLDEYLKMADQAVAVAIKVLIGFALYLLFSLGLTQDPLYWMAHTAVALGFILTVIAFIVPNVKQSLNGYYIYSSYGKPIWRSRFYHYREFFASIGHPIKDDMRGAGLSWVLRYFHLMCAVTVYLFLGAIALAVITQLHSFNVKSFLGLLFVLVLSVSPILMAESSRAVQVGRSYFPGFIGIMFFIGYVVSSILPTFDLPLQQIIWDLIGGLVAASVVINLKVLLTDVLPSRMAVNDLVRFLRKEGIKKFYTYGTAHNEVFVHCIPESTKKEFNIQLISHIDEVKEGYVVVPPVNLKSVMMSDFPLARSSNNVFAEDSKLDAMIDTRLIEAKAIASFETMSSSCIWVHEAEVPTFRFFSLKEITPKDFYRGKAWVLKI